MKLLQINTVYGMGSTGRIAAEIAEEYAKKGWEVRVAYGRGAYVTKGCKISTVQIGNPMSVRLHGVLTRLFDWHGDRVCSWWATRKFLKWAEAWGPDVLWLHNLHGYYINYELLFRWIKQHPKMRVKWNLHDCWAFTGHCSHFQLTGCDRWKTGCYDCPEMGEYPATRFLSSAKTNWERKREAFCGVTNLSLIVPSKWLADLTRQSFLGEYPIEVRKHPLDTSVFKPTPSDWRVQNGLVAKVVILGVAAVWDRRKGLQDFVALRKLLNEKYVIVLVGLTEKQIVALPDGIIGIARTNSAKELAEIYSAADWFFNPTHEDIYSMTNMEAAACGCRVVTYDTGGAPEAVESYDKVWVLKDADKSPEGFSAIVARGTHL